MLEVADRLPALEEIVFLDPRGMRRYDRKRLHAYADVQARGREARRGGARGHPGRGSRRRGRTMSA